MQTWFVAWGAINLNGALVNGHFLHDFHQGYDPKKIAEEMIEMIAAKHVSVPKGRIYFTNFHKL